MLIVVNDDDIDYDKVNNDDEVDDHDNVDDDDVDVDAVDSGVNDNNDNYVDDDDDDDNDDDDAANVCLDNGYYNDNEPGLDGNGTTCSQFKATLW